MKSTLPPRLAYACLALAATCVPAAAGWPEAAEIALLTASDGAAEDVFGTSVAIAGDAAIVGSPFDDDEGLNSGSAYVYERNHGGAGSWGEARKLTFVDGVVGDEFGTSVSISGEHAVVGAQRSDIGGTNRGAAFVFARGQGGAGNWGQVAALIADDGAFQDYFGAAVDISGDWLVVGAKEDDDRGMQSGSAYVFGRNAGGANAWGQVAKLTASDGAGNDLFGSAVAISGDWVAVGSLYGDGLVANSGAVYVYGRNVGGANNWGQVAKVVSDDGSLNDRFGISLDLDGNRLVVGASGEDSTSVDSGAAYVFALDPNAPADWDQIAKLVADDGALGDQLGISVAISGERVLAGAQFDDDQGNESGSAYVFWQDEGGAEGWGQVAKLVALGGATDDRFGFAAALSGDTALVGALRSDELGTESGSARVFDLSGVGTAGLFRDGFEDD